MAHSGSLMIKVSITFGILLFLGLLGTGYLIFLHARTAQQQHQQSMEVWRSVFEKAYDANKQALSSSKDMNSILIAMNNFQADLKDWSAPAEPKLFGISLLTPDQVQARTPAIQQADKTVGVINDTQALLTYQVKVTTVFMPVNNPQASTLDQLKTLSTAWSTAAAGFAAITPPAQAQAIQQKFGQALGAVTTSIATLVRLYQQQDLAGFNAERPAFVSALNTFQDVDNQLVALTQTQMTALLTQVQVLTTALSSY